jgi:hypothetical protein
MSTDLGSRMAGAAAAAAGDTGDDELGLDEFGQPHGAAPNRVRADVL